MGWKRTSLNENDPQAVKVKHTRLDWLDKMAQHGMFCHYCKVELTSETVTKDHLTPTCRGGSDLIKNIVPCCLPCNSMKTWRTAEEFEAQRVFLSTRQRSTSLLKPRGPFRISAEERYSEPGLLKRVLNERERTSWSWKHPYSAEEKF